MEAHLTSFQFKEYVEGRLMPGIVQAAGDKVIEKFLIP